MIWVIFLTAWVGVGGFLAVCLPAERRARDAAYTQPEHVQRQFAERAR